MDVYPVASKLSWGRKGTARDFFFYFIIMKDKNIKQKMNKVITSQFPHNSLT